MVMHMVAFVHICCILFLDSCITKDTCGSSGKIWNYVSTFHAPQRRPDSDDNRNRSSIKQTQNLLSNLEYAVTSILIRLTIMYSSQLLLCSNGSHFFVFRKNIWDRPDRSNSKLIDLLMTLGIVFLNVLKIRRLPERRNIPVKATHPAMNGRVSGANITDVALEVLHVDGVKADNSREKSDIDLGDR